MGHTIKEIKPGEKFEYDGDVHVTGSIGSDANVYVKGSLTVDGDIEEGGVVHLELGSDRMFLFPNGALIVKGNVYDKVSITSDGAYYKICGFVGNYCTLTNFSWAINIIGGVGESSKLSTVRAFIYAGYMARFSSAITDCDIIVKGADPFARLISNNGTVYIKSHAPSLSNSM